MKAVEGVLSVLFVDKDGLIIASKAIDTNTEQKLGAMSTVIEPVMEKIKTEFKIILADQVTRKLRNNAPHYVAAF